MTRVLCGPSDDSSRFTDWIPSTWHSPDISCFHSAYHSALADHLKADASVVFLDCAFDVGGPWAGISTMLRDLVSTADEHQQHIIQKHSFELVHALPHLRNVLTVSNPTLTDLAKDEEKVRNYAADRAYRIVHGLINLLDEFSGSSPATSPIVFICHRFDDAGVICQKFFVELLRRRAERLNIKLVLGISEKATGYLKTLFPDHSRVDCIVLPTSPLSPELTPSETQSAASLAQEIETAAGTSRTAIAPRLPELISLWTIANRPSKVLQWRLYATAFYCNLGLYADALRYADGLVDFAAAQVPGSEVLQWWVVNKVLNAHTGLGNGAQGLALAEGDAPRLASFVDPIWRSQLYYLTAMLYSRYSTPRDYDRGEHYLDLGLEAIASSAISEEDRHFHRVFNRNGLAMIRSFQGRHEEAIALCQEGIDSLVAHLGLEQHKLHRSILHYNIAQVYAATRSFEEALSWYSAAMDMDPNYSEYYNERGNIYFKLGRIHEAYRDYVRAIELSPPYHEVLTNLGQCQRALGDLDAAIHSYTEALDLQPDDLLALEGRAKALEEAGRFAEAEREYTAALERGDDRWEVLANRGVMRYQQGDVKGCISDLSRAIDIIPSQPDLYHNRSLAYSALGQHAEALADLNAALALDLSPTERESAQRRINALVATIREEDVMHSA